MRYDADDFFEAVPARFLASVAFAHSYSSVGTCAATVVLAADDTAPAAAAALEEIVVTATRREENISRVPISITALSQETLDEKGIKDFDDIARFTPGVAFDTSETNQICDSRQSPRAAARAPPASTSMMCRSRCAPSDSIPMTRC